MSSGSTKKPVAVYGAMAANIAIAISKFAAGALTGSSAMFSEGIHSLVDTGNELLLLLGIRMSEKPPDKTHPFGHGQDFYFWSLIVALILFGVGGGVSAYEGIRRLQHPGDLGDITMNLAASEKGNTVETALKGALDAITRQVREHRERLRTRWKQP